MIQPDTLTKRNEQPLEQDVLLNIADRAVVRHEFVIAYEEPIDVYGKQSAERGYLTIWVRDMDDTYKRMQMLSGDNKMIQTYLSECASHGVEKIERLIDSQEVLQP